MKIKKAVIPAAGLGTRFLPATIAQPKEMLPIASKPAIQYVIEEAAAAGIKEILIITGKTKRAIEDHFDQNTDLENALKAKGKSRALREIKKLKELARIYYIRQIGQKGLGDALSYAESFVANQPFAVMLGDAIFDAKIPPIAELMKFFQKGIKAVIGAEIVSQDKVERYGIIKGRKINKNLLSVSNLIEKPQKNKAPSRIAIAARYILTPDIFAILKKTKKGKGGEIQLTDALGKLCQRGKVLAKIVNGKRYDIGNSLDYLKACIKFTLQDKKAKKELIEFINKLNNNY